MTAGHPDRRSGGVTLRQIAQQAGCAVSAVSTVLNGARGTTGVSAEVQQRIRQCAEELGYEANYHARALRAGRASTIGLLLGPGNDAAVHTRFFAPIMAGVEAGVRQAGSDLLIVGPSAGESELDRGLRYCRQGRVDALVVPGLMYQGQWERIAQAVVPIAVALANAPPGHPVVRISEKPGVGEALRHLADLGHREVLWLNLTVNGVDHSPDRSSAVRDLARGAGMTCRTVAASVASPDDLLDLPGWVDTARARVAADLRTRRPPTAVLAYNELCALGVYAALADAGLRVPGDVSVIGFDDITASVALPPMTVVSLRLRDVGLTAAALALELASDPGARQRLTGSESLVPTRLVVRDSTGPAPAEGIRKRKGTR